MLVEYWSTRNNVSYQPNDASYDERRWNEPTLFSKEVDDLPPGIPSALQSSTQLEEMGLNIY